MTPPQVAALINTTLVGGSAAVNVSVAISEAGAVWCVVSGASDAAPAAADVAARGATAQVTAEHTPVTVEVVSVSGTGNKRADCVARDAVGHLSPVATSPAFAYTGACAAWALAAIAPC